MRFLRIERTAKSQHSTLEYAQVHLLLRLAQIEEGSGYFPFVEKSEKCQQLGVLASESRGSLEIYERKMPSKRKWHFLV